MGEYIWLGTDAPTNGSVLVLSTSVVKS